MDKDDLILLREDIKELEKNVRRRLDEHSSDIDALENADTTIHQRIDSIDSAAEKLVDSERD